MTLSWRLLKMTGKTSGATDDKIGHFTVVCLVTWCMNASEAGPCFDTDRRCVSHLKFK